MKRGHCPCWNFRGLEEHFDFADVFACAAPRPLVCEIGEQERAPGGFPVDVARKAFAEVRAAYQVLGADDRLHLDIHPGGHVFHGVQFWGPLQAALGGGPGAAQPEGAFNLVLRYRVALPDGQRFETRERAERWEPKKAAIIICDMWDLHHCKRAVNRVQELAPRMNEVIARARSQGVFIIHAPSSCMAPYEDTPMRRRAKDAPRAKNLPKDIGTWCHRIPAEEKGRYPIDQSDGGEDDDPAEHAAWVEKLTALGRNPKAPWKSQIDVLTMDERDAVSDSGVEIWNLLEDRGIDHVILMGVHTNMCVLGRPFGLRQMAKNGKHVVLMRDMTDTMYNPASWPHVSHFRGTELIIEHIEKFVCPTITSDQILGGKPFRFKNDIP
jgi:nicotinamidase-related amidase